MGKQTNQHTAIKITDRAKNSTFIGCKVNGAVEIEKEAKDSTFVNTEITTTPLLSPKWWEHTLMKYPAGLIGTLLVAYLVYLFGWN
jgi:hypothetical protein